MLLDLVERTIARAVGFVSGEHQGEETAEQSQQSLLDDQNLTSPEMQQQPQGDHRDASGGNWTTVQYHTITRSEGRPHPAPGADTHRPHRESRLRKQDRSHSPPRAQSAHRRSLENDRNRLASEHQLLERKYRQLSEEHKSVVSDLHKSQVMCKEKQQEIDRLRKKLHGSSALLEVRNQELKVAKAFLSKEDTFSASDVVQLVRDLNSEIMQAAAYLAESLPLKRLRTPSAEEVPEGPCKSTFVTLVLPLGSGDGADVGSVELALQDFLAWYAVTLASAWSLSQEVGWYNELYSMVCKTEDRTVASNWRALTRRTISRMDSSHDDLLRVLVNRTIVQLAELFAFCGIGDPMNNTNIIHKHAAEKLEVIYATAQKLNKMIGENVISEDLIVTFVHSGTTFDGKLMEDAYARAGSKSDQRTVACTTELGLCEWTDMKGAGKVLLKPKVVLLGS